MNIIHALISGIVQGATEFLPVSSSGHLVMLHHFFGYREPQIFFDILLHVGTLVAVLIFFRKDIIALFSSERRSLLFIVIASVPTAIIGFLFSDWFEGLFTQVRVVGFMLFVTGFWLLLGGRRLRTQNSEPQTSQWNIKKVLLVGISQAAAIIPGISRSGSTISTGLLLGIKPEEAFKFSFLLSAPAILGALIFKIKDVGGLSLIPADIIIYLIGMAAACITGILALKILRETLKRARLHLFSIWCFVIGLIAILAG